jgi:hypothetical protein
MAVFGMNRPNDANTARLSTLEHAFTFDINSLPGVPQ